MKRRFFYHITAVLIATIIAGSFFYYLICLGLRQSKQDAIGKYNYLTSDTTYYNTVFFGASTVHLGINAILFDSIVGSSSYNAGVDGMCIAEVNAVIKKYVASHGAPKNVFIALDEKTLGMESGVWYFSQYYPFVNDTALSEIVQLEPKLLLGKYAPFWAVTYIDDPLKNLGLIGLVKGKCERGYAIPLRGFKPAYWPGLKEELPIEPTYFAGSSAGWNLLNNTLRFCAQKNIHVDFVVAPRYNCILSDSTVKYMAKLYGYETQYHSSLFNFAVNDSFKSNKLFPNRTHLNATGAEKFTTLLAKAFLVQQADTSSN